MFILSGIQYIVDNDGNRKAVVIDLTTHRDAWEEFSRHWIEKGKMEQPPLVSFTHLFSDADLEEISNAIEEHCEKVDSNEW